MNYIVKKDDLPPDLEELVEIIGLQSLLNLIEDRGGESIYIPKPDKVQRAARDRFIRDEFDGSNYKELARKYKLSIVWVRNIVNGS